MLALPGGAEIYPPSATLTPALDIIRTRPTGPAHSEFNGIPKLARELLVNAILTVDGQRNYISQLQFYPFPQGWGRLQSEVESVTPPQAESVSVAELLTKVDL